MSATYGSDQEGASRALLEMLDMPAAAVPVERADQLQLLRCRDAAIDALAERMTLLGAQPSPAQDRGPSVSLTRLLAHRGAIDWLAAEVARMPRLPVELKGSPYDALSTPSSHRLVEAARRAGGLLQAANQSIRPDRDDSPLVDPRAGWVLIDDIATTAEALIALDAGLLRGLVRDTCADGRSPSLTTTARLGCATVGRIASWHGAHHDEVDSSMATINRQGLAGPVVQIGQPKDFITAHRRLITYLRPGPRHAAPLVDGSREPAIDRRSATAAVLAMGGFLKALSSDLETRGRRWEPIAAQAREQASVLEAVHDNLSTLSQRTQAARDGGPVRLSPVLLQAQELHKAARQSAGLADVFDRGQVLDLLAYSHQASQHLAARLLTELGSTQGWLAAARGGAVGGLPIPARARRTALGASLQRMRDTPPPLLPVRPSARQHREALRMQLAEHAPRTVTPNPYEMNGPGL